LDIYKIHGCDPGWKAKKRKVIRAFEMGHAVVAANMHTPRATSSTFPNWEDAGNVCAYLAGKAISLGLGALFKVGQLFVLALRHKLTSGLLEGAQRDELPTVEQAVLLL
jgi:hypothetical protein